MSESEDVWHRRIERERAARKQAEALLERKSLELFESNARLQSAYDELEARVAERTLELSRANSRLHAEIEERLRAERSLLASESQAKTLALVASRTVNAVVITDAEGRIEWINDGFERITGFSSGEVIGRKPGAFLQGPESNPETIRYMSERIACGQMFECDIVNYAKSGRKYWIHIEAQPLYDESGRLSHFMAIQTDVTQRRETEQSLRESEERFRTLADSAPVLVWLTDAEGKFYYFNATWLRFAGRALDSETGQGWFEGVHDDDKARVIDEYRSAFEARKPIRSEFRLRHADGHFRWILNTGVPRLTSDGKFEGYVGSAVDIHDLKKNAAALADRIRLASLESEIGYAVTQVGPLEEILNRCATSISGHLGACHTLIWAITDEPGVLELKASLGDCEVQALDRKRFAVGEFRIGRIVLDRQPVLIEDLAQAAGNLDLGTVCGIGPKAFVALPLVVENRLVGYLASMSQNGFPGSILTDLKSVADAISIGIERKNAEQALLKAKLEAEEANRSKSEFVANMSHEVRTPLGAILGYNEVLMDPSVNAAQRAEIHERVRANGEHLLQILNDILDLSKIEAGRLFLEKIRVSPDEVVAETMEILHVRAEEKGVRLDVQRIGDVPAGIVTDPTRLRQILLNLLGNAIKFTPSGKRIVVGIEANVTDDRLTFFVEDEGIGMSNEQRNKLFRPFVQGDSSTTRRFGGTGLGLSISKRLADMLGGAMTVSSQPGAGSRFSFSLPLALVAVDDQAIAGDLGTNGTDPSRQARDGSTSESSPSPDETIQGARILLCEDNADNRRVIGFMLKRAGVDLDYAENGRIALEKIRSSQYDLVLMDMQMPELDGYTTTRWLRADGYTMPIVAVTAHAMREDRGKCLSAGCDAYVPKPIDLKLMLTTVTRLLARSRQHAGASDAK